MYVISDRSGLVLERGEDYRELRRILGRRYPKAEREAYGITVRKVVTKISRNGNTITFSAEDAQAIMRQIEALIEISFEARKCPELEALYLALDQIEQ